MKKRIWAVLCGMVRQEFELYNIISLLCEWRSKGIIEGIVISTWVGEPDVLLGFREKCRLLGIYIVESPPLGELDNKCSNISYFRQATQVNAALSKLPDDVWVLKCRTDYSMDAVYKLREAFDADLTAKNIGAFTPIVRHKIAVLKFSTSFPFVLEDLAFFAHRSDLMRMIIFEDHTRLVKNGFAPDLLFFLNVVLHEYPFITDYLRMLDYFTLGNSLWKDFSNNMHIFKEEGLCLPSVLNKFYALYLMIFEANFYLCSLNKYDESSFTLDDLFVPNDLKGVLMRWGVIIVNPKLITSFINGKVLPSKGWYLISAEIQRLIMDYDYAFNLSVTLHDYYEMIKWGEKYLGLKNRRGIHWSRFSCKSINSITGKEADEILFSDYYTDQEGKEAIFNIWGGGPYGDLGYGNVGYYEKISHELPALKSNAQLYEIALASAARAGKITVLRRIAEDLAKGNVSKENEKALSMVIERWRRFDFMFERTDKDSLIMFFWYGRYKAAQGDDYYSDVVDKICLKWRLKVDKNTSNGEYLFISVLKLLHDSLDEENEKIKNSLKEVLGYIKSLY